MFIIPSSVNYVYSGYTKANSAGLLQRCWFEWLIMCRHQLFVSKCSAHTAISSSDRFNSAAAFVNDLVVSISAATKSINRLLAPCSRTPWLRLHILVTSSSMYSHGTLFCSNAANLSYIEIGPKYMGPTFLCPEWLLWVILVLQLRFLAP